jgi:hypothetical protein
MKILDAKMMVTSHNSSEQMDLSLKEETRTRFARKSQAPSNNRFIGMGTQGGVFQGMVVDRAEHTSGIPVGLLWRNFIQINGSDSPDGGNNGF